MQTTNPTPLVLTIQPTERSSLSSITTGADPIATMPFGEYFADFAKNPGDLGLFGVGFDGLFDKSVDCLG